MSYRVINLLILSPPEPLQVLYQTLAFRDWGFGFRVEGFRDWGLEFRICMGLSIRTGIIRGIIVPIKGGGAGNQRSCNNSPHSPKMPIIERQHMANIFSISILILPFVLLPWLVWLAVYHWGADYIKHHGPACSVDTHCAECRMLLRLKFLRVIWKHPE